jgi:hypothetical protein
VKNRAESIQRRANAKANNAFDHVVRSQRSLRSRLVGANKSEMRRRLSRALSLNAISELLNKLSSVGRKKGAADIRQNPKQNVVKLLWRSGGQFLRQAQQWLRDRVDRFDQLLECIDGRGQFFLVFNFRRGLLSPVDLRPKFRAFHMPNHGRLKTLAQQRDHFARSHHEPHDRFASFAVAPTGSGLSFARGCSVRIPVYDLEKLLAHHAVVLAGEVEALLDLKAVGLHHSLPLDLLRNFCHVLVGKATLEMFFKELLDPADSYERVFSASVTNHATDLRLYFWYNSHGAILT